MVRTPIVERLSDAVRVRVRRRRTTRTPLLPAATGSDIASSAGRRLTVNGADVDVDVGPLTTVLEVLREQLRLTGTKQACDRGECGACTVLVGGRTVNACTTLAQRVSEPIETIEGLAAETHELRQRFADHGAFQCGYCTPGQVVRAAWMARNRLPADSQRVRRELAGNICRCTGYAGIVAAVTEHLGARAETDGGR